ncbi:MAG: SIMPL domain-containing protein [Betaproteobacteria bacterium]
MKTASALLAGMLLPAVVLAQLPIAAPTDLPAVSLTTSATAQVDNDRMTIVLQAESEKPQATAAASEVNARMGKALAIAKAVSGVTAKTVSYSTDQVMEKGKMVRWRVSQLLQIETAEFTAGASLATRLQEEGLLLSSLTFNVSPEARRIALARLQHEALTEWQVLAKQAAASMGYASYAPGRLTVNTNDNGPRPRFAARAMSAVAAEPVAVASGSSEIVMTVSGEAILAGTRKRE